MKGLSVSLLLGTMLVSVLLLAYWVRTPHPVNPRWSVAVDRGLDSVDLLGDQSAR